MPGASPRAKEADRTRVGIFLFLLIIHAFCVQIINTMIMESNSIAAAGDYDDESLSRSLQLWGRTHRNWLADGLGCVLLLPLQRIRQDVLFCTNIPSVHGETEDDERETGFRLVRRENQTGMNS